MVRAIMEESSGRLAAGVQASGGSAPDRRRRRMQIKIDESRCIGCGLCAAAVPEVFAIVGRVSTAVGAPEKSRESRVFDAANGCPVNAISAKR